MHLIGYGNPGRGDDGLGPAFAERIAERNVSDLNISTDYQLTVDHALLISGARSVVFVDALMKHDAPFRFGAVRPAPSHSLTSHSLDPSAVLALAQMLFGSAVEAHVLGISGIEFGEVREGLSPTAEENLDLAGDFFMGWLTASRQLGEARSHANA